MKDTDLESTLKNIVERLLDARDEIEGDDDDITLADIAREMVDQIEGIAGATTFEEAGLATRDAGLVVLTSRGSKFQVSIVKTR